MRGFLGFGRGGGAITRLIGREEIASATKPYNLTGAVAALDLQLTGEEVAALEEHYTQRLPTCFN